MMKPRIGVIAIVAHGGAIGRGGDQPFHIKEDFRHFKALTLGKPIVMGRKTFEALPTGTLPGRTNIVVTRNADWSAEGVVTAASLDEAIAKGFEENSEEVMIIGGGEIYRQAMPLATNLYITEVDGEVADYSKDKAYWALFEGEDYAMQGIDQTVFEDGDIFKLVYSRG